MMVNKCMEYFEYTANSPSGLAVHKSKIDLTAKWIEVDKGVSCVQHGGVTCQGDDEEFKYVTYECLFNLS